MRRLERANHHPSSGQSGTASRSQDSLRPVLSHSRLRRSSMSCKRLAPSSEQILQSLSRHALPIRASLRTLPRAFVTKGLAPLLSVAAVTAGTAPPEEGDQL